MRYSFFSMLLLSMLLIVSISSFVSAEIFLEQPSSVYNLGDDFSVDARVSEIIDGYFSMELICGQDKVLLVRDILSSTIIHKELTLTKAYIDSLIGQCSLLASYGESLSQSQSFTITKKVDAYAELDKKEFLPSESMGVYVEAHKANGDALEGFSEISFLEANVSLTKVVKGGVLSTNLTIPYNMPAGTYSLKIWVYEKDKQGGITNEASLEKNFVVRQEARNVEIAISDQEATPGNDYVFKILVYDQSNSSMETEVKYSLYNNVSLVEQKLVNSDESISIKVPRNESPGYRNILAEVSGLSAKRSFYIPEVQKAEFSIFNSTLNAVNIGNVPYKKSVEVSIGNTSKVVDVNMPVGGSSKFSLHAPEGTYDIKVSGGNEDFTASGVLLTGRSIAVSDYDDSPGIIGGYPLVWLFLIGILGMFIFGLSRSMGMKKFFARMPRFRSKKELHNDSIGDNSKVIVGSKKASEILIPEINVLEAEHSLVLRGQKQDSTIISLNIKNKKGLKSDGPSVETLGKILELMRSSKGVSYTSGNYLFGLFVPSITKTFKNDLNAIRISEEIKNVLDDHNNKFSEKIVYGIGINNGDIISNVDKASKKLQFTGVGNTIPLSKKVADTSANHDGTLFISENTHKKTMSVVKTKNVKITDDFMVYSISSIIEREQHSKFINDFLRRQKEEK